MPGERDAPETRYAKTADGVHIAYQVVGEGPTDLVMVPEWISQVELVWADPTCAALFARLSSFTRLILFDRRGVGLSDPVPREEAPTLERSVDDVRAVLDAADSNTAALFGVAEGGPINAMFAATYPERVSALILINSYARLAQAPDYPFGMPEQIHEPWLKALESMWGSGDTVNLLCPSRADDVAYRAWWARIERGSVSPSEATATFRRMFKTDVRAVLPTLHVPTLVLHRAGDRWIRSDHGRFLANHIEGAKYVELEGEDHMIAAGDVDALVDEVEEFLTGVRPARQPDRILATVMFTDIVGSTEIAAARGDERWRHLLDAHHAIAGREVDRHRGRLIKTTGDGILATFDAPGRAINCARALRESVRSLGLQIRAGVHTGEAEIMGDDVGGIAVHIAARVMAEAGPGEVVVSSTVKDLVAGSGMTFQDRGLRGLKGVPDEWRLFTVESG